MAALAWLFEVMVVCAVATIPLVIALALWTLRARRDLAKTIASTVVGAVIGLFVAQILVTLLTLGTMLLVRYVVGAARWAAVAGTWGGAIIVALVGMAALAGALGIRREGGGNEGRSDPEGPFGRVLVGPGAATFAVGRGRFASDSALQNDLFGPAPSG
jgi:hypothetical protein